LLEPIPLPAEFPEGIEETHTGIEGDRQNQGAEYYHPAKSVDWPSRVTHLKRPAKAFARRPSASAAM
jgi:hypothetical protein